VQPKKRCQTAASFWCTGAASGPARSTFGWSGRVGRGRPAVPRRLTSGSPGLLRPLLVIAHARRPRATRARAARRTGRRLAALRTDRAQAQRRGQPTDRWRTAGVPNPGPESRSDRRVGQLPSGSMEEIQRLVEELLAGILSYVWDGKILPMPIDEIADTYVGLLVRDVEDLATAPVAPEFATDRRCQSCCCHLGEIWINAEEGRQWPAPALQNRARARSLAPSPRCRTPCLLPVPGRSSPTPQSPASRSPRRGRGERVRSLPADARTPDLQNRVEAERLRLRPRCLLQSDRARTSTMPAR
jgi:hypothetical protein